MIQLYLESLRYKPKIIVELGVRGGESTFVFERVAKLYNSALISVDIEECSNICYYKKWNFIKSDDIKFAKRFSSWCLDNGLKPRIDVLFIDTSHMFEHTKKEINLWFPYLSKQATVFFHDTNLKEEYSRRDGSVGIGWNNERGVIEALEQYFGEPFKEEVNFVKYKKNWIIKHFHYCNGLTILTKFND